MPKSSSHVLEISNSCGLLARVDADECYSDGERIVLKKNGIAVFGVSPVGDHSIIRRDLEPWERA